MSTLQHHWPLYPGSAPSAEGTHRLPADPLHTLPPPQGEDVWEDVIRRTKTWQDVPILLGSVLHELGPCQRVPLLGLIGKPHQSLKTLEEALLTVHS